MTYLRLDPRVSAFDNWTVQEVRCRSGVERSSLTSTHPHWIIFLGLDLGLGQILFSTGIGLQPDCARGSLLVGLLGVALFAP